MATSFLALLYIAVSPFSGVLFVSGYGLAASGFKDIAFLMSHVLGI